MKETANNVDEAVRELPDANLVSSINFLFVIVIIILIIFGDYVQKPEDLWANHSKLVLPKPHMKSNPSWRAIQKVCDTEVYKAYLGHII